MDGKSIYIAAALAGGAVLPLQALINARLGVSVGGPATATTISFAIGTMVLLVFIAAVRVPMPSAAALTALPWWAWTGGILGAFYVANATLTAPVLGAAGMVALIVLGQMLASLVLDHFGVLHGAQPVTVQRLLGAGLLVAGVWLITRQDIPVLGPV